MTKNDAETERESLSMLRTVKAVYEIGVLRPLQATDLEGGQEVEILISPQSLTDDEAEARLRELESRLYGSLSDEKLTELQQTALDRIRCFTRKSDNA